VRYTSVNQHVSYIPVSLKNSSLGRLMIRIEPDNLPPLFKVQQPEVF
jgi:hypothetical protein